MLTAELLRRNNRLNQDPIAEEAADGASFDKSGGGRNATLKLKRRISREPNTGKILILPDNTPGSNEHAPAPYSPTNRQGGGVGSTQPTPTSKEHQMVVERFSTGGGFNGSGTKANNTATASGKKNSPGGLYNISPTA